MNLELIKKYAPYIYFDRNEPFFPVKVGITVFETPGRSKSMSRSINFDTDKVAFAIEYAIYWHFDIGHLYELEHYWVYVGKDGQVVDSEASFHGRYLKGLLKDRSNIEDGTHVRTYSQPGKHAFSPVVMLLELLPDLYTTVWDGAGGAGLITTDVCKGRYSTNDEINALIKKYLQQYKFRPSMEFARYVIPEELYIPWEELDNQIPGMIEQKLKEMRKEVEEL